MTESTEPLDPKELHDEDFQFALKALLAAYQPILEEELKRSKSPDDLTKAAHTTTQRGGLT